MRFLKRLMVTVIVVVGLLALIGLFLPQQVNVERSVAINVSAEEIFQLVAEMRRFNEWSPWAKIDPDARLTFQGPESGVGAGMTWRSDNPNVGNGSVVITAAIPYKEIRTSLDFGEQGTAESYYHLVPVGSGGSTEVTWGFTTDMGNNPVSRWFGLMMDRWVGADYAKGLQNMKELLE